MLPRFSSYVLVVVAVVFSAGVARAQNEPPSPLQLTSLEWLVADSEVMVRGIVVDVAVDKNWNLVTLDVRESLKGAKTERVRFAVYQFATGDAALAQMKQSKQEQLWILKRQDSGVPGEAPDREKVLGRHKIELYAPFLPGRPGEPALPVFPLGSSEPDAGTRPPSFLTIDLRLLKTSDEIVKAIRTTLEETQGQEPARAYSVSLPQEVALRTGFSRTYNQLTVPP